MRFPRYKGLVVYLGLGVTNCAEKSSRLIGSFVFRPAYVAFFREIGIFHFVIQPRSFGKPASVIIRHPVCPNEFASFIETGPR